MADSSENKGMRDCFTQTTLFNQLDFIIERKIREMVNTSAVVRIDSCTSNGAEEAAGSVSATPLVANVDAYGNALTMTSIPKMPHARLQGGIAAIVIDPVAGDIGLASFCKADSSTVTPGTSSPQRPGSYRSFDQADGVVVASISNQAPEVWIELKQDKTIVIHAPEGCTIETDKTVTVTAEKSILLDTPLVQITGNLVQTGDRGSGASSFTGGFTNTGGTVTSNGVVLETHTHSGVEPGSGSTGQPN